MRSYGPAAARTVAVLAMVGMSMAWPSAAAPNAKAGAAISAPCAACHGSNGISADTSTPDLAGQHYSYLLNQLEAYKNGTRKNPIMNEMIGSLSEEQMQDLAAYFSSIPIQVGSPSAKK